jgi:hypothetical protein
MNNFKTSPKEQRITDARQVEATVTLTGESVCFPSYLRVLGISFWHFHGGSRWGIAPFHVGFSQQLPKAQASVAFV